MKLDLFRGIKVPMKKAVSIFMLAVTLTVLPGCNSQWWQNFKADPVAYVTRFEQQVENFLATAAILFNVLRPFLPADKAAQIETAYSKAVFTVRHSLAALNDAVQTAVDAQNPNPDFSKLINDVIASVNELTAIIDEFRNGGLHTPAIPQVQQYPDGFADLKTQQTSIGRYKR